jgi:hypothetical protein
MSCRHCAHCTADPVLRLPESHQPADPAYDRALLAAYDAAAERTRQPVRLLVQVNPWLTRDRVHDQLERARSRGVTGAVDRDAVQQLLAHPGYVYLTTHGAIVGPDQVVAWELAEDTDDALQLLAAARKVHAGT